MGSKKWINFEIAIFDAVDFLLRVGKQKLDRVTMLCRKNDKKWFRNGEIFKSKFEKTSFHEKINWHCGDSVECIKSQGNKGEDFFK